MGTIVALVNNKGGVGKTTTAINLAVLMAMKKKKTLLLDIDSQTSASLSLGFKREEKPNIADVFFLQQPVQETVKPTKVNNLDMIIAHKDIAKFDQEFGDKSDNTNLLKTQIDFIRNDYEYVFIDSPPSLSLLTINVLTCADKLIVPVTPDYLSLEGLGTLLNLLGPDAPYRILLSMVDYRLRVTKEVIGFIREQFKDKVFKTEIRQNVKLKEAPSYYQSIFAYALYSTGAKCFISLGKEFSRW